MKLILSVDSASLYMRNPDDAAWALRDVAQQIENQINGVFRTDGLVRDPDMNAVGTWRVEYGRTQQRVNITHLVVFNTRNTACGMRLVPSPFANRKAAGIRKTALDCENAIYADGRVPPGGVPCKECFPNGFLTGMV